MAGSWDPHLHSNAFFTLSPSSSTHTPPKHMQLSVSISSRSGENEGLYRTNGSLVEIVINERPFLLVLSFGKPLESAPFLLPSRLTLQLAVPMN